MPFPEFAKALWSLSSSIRRSSRTPLPNQQVRQRFKSKGAQYLSQCLMCAIGKVDSLGSFSLRFVISLSLFSLVAFTYTHKHVSDNASCCIAGLPR